MTEPYVINEDGWAAIPEPLLYNPRICAEAVRVYGVLRRHGDDPANCYPSHSRIAGFIGKSPRSIPGWIRQLEKAGWVERFARKAPSGDPDSNGYRVFGRVGERGVRAGEQGPSAPDSREGSTPHSAPKESNGERESLNENARAQESFFTDDNGSSANGSREKDPDYGFEKFWTAYPPRKGHKLNKAKAAAIWRKLTYDEKRDAWRGAKNLAAAAEVDDFYPVDAFRWLRDRSWPEWVEVPTKEPELDPLYDVR